MKQIAFDDMYCWSIFNEVRQIDFNGHLWIRDGGNVLIDPVPMSEEDLRQFGELGGARWIVITNCDHEREAAFFKERTGAEVVAHAADADAMEVAVDRTVEDGVEIVAGLRVVHLQHGKSPGELALYWPRRKLLLAGDLVVGAPVGKFSLLLDAKLADPPQAALELRKLLRLDFDAILVGDGHSIMTGRARCCCSAWRSGRISISTGSISRTLPGKKAPGARAMTARSGISTRSSARGAWAIRSSGYRQGKVFARCTSTTSARRCSTSWRDPARC